MKRKFCIAFTVVFVLTMMLAGCGKSNFGVRVNEDLNIEIIAENAVFCEYNEPIIRMAV